MKLTYPPAGTDERSATAETQREQLLPRLSRRWPRAGAMLLLAALVVPLNAMHVKDHPFLSPFDEMHHIDYVLRAADGQIVLQPDDQFTQESLREFACHGREATEPPDPNRETQTTPLPEGVTALPECGRERYEPDDFAFRGLNAAAAHTPYYYATTGGTARVLAALPATPNNLVTWSRLLGSAWLLLGCYLILRAADALGIRRSSTVLAVFLVIATPVVLHASTTVNPDATAFTVGALAVLAALAWERGRSLWLLGAAAFTCAALDPTNSLALMLVLFYFGVRAVHAWQRSPSVEAEPAQSPKSYVRAALVVVGAAVLAVVSWELLYGRLADNRHLLELNPHHSHYLVDGLQLDQLIGRTPLFGNFPPVYAFPDIAGVVPETLQTMAREIFTAAAGFFMIGAVLAVIIGAVHRSARFSALAIATLASLILAAPALILYNYLSADIYFFIPTRMLLSLVPAMAIVTAAVCTGRTARVALAVCAIGLYLAAVVPLADAVLA